MARFARFSSRGVVLQERRFVQRADGVVERAVVLMPVVHVASRKFFADTIRSERFSRFHLVYHEGPAPGCAMDAVEPKWRFIESPRSASPLGLLLEASWLTFFRVPLALSNRFCQLLGWEPLTIQPAPLCPPANVEHPRFVSTDTTSLSQTLLAIVSLGAHDPRAERLVVAIGNASASELAATGPEGKPLEIVVPWGIAHMSYVAKRLLELGYTEAHEDARDHVACSWGTALCAHLFIWLWWWSLHAFLDAWASWTTEGRVAIRMPMYWLWGATLHVGPSALEDRPDRPTGLRSLTPPEGALEKYWGR